MTGGSVPLPDDLLRWRGRDTAPHIAPVFVMNSDDQQHASSRHEQSMCTTLWARKASGKTFAYLCALPRGDWRLTVAPSCTRKRRRVFRDRAREQSAPSSVFFAQDIEKKRNPFNTVPSFWGQTTWNQCWISFATVVSPGGGSLRPV